VTIKKEDKKEEEEKEPNMPKSKLQEGVLDLIKFIFDIKLIEKSIVTVGYDIKKLPLGSLASAHLLKGYHYLKEIEKVLNKKSKESLADLTSSFYTYIPHNFGFQKMAHFIIDTKEKLKEKMDLI